MRILVDECVPRQIVQFFQNDEIHTVPELGWSGIKNGELIKLAEAKFDIFYYFRQKSPLSTKSYRSQNFYC